MTELFFKVKFCWFSSSQEGYLKTPARSLCHWSIMLMFLGTLEYPVIVLTCIFLRINDVKHLFICLLGLLDIILISEVIKTAKSSYILYTKFPIYHSK